MTADPPSAPERARLLRQRIRTAAARLATAGIAAPTTDATTLAEFALGVRRLDPLHPPHLDDSFEEQFAALIERRCRREPLQLITGSAPFRFLDLAVGPGVFVPRPETEWVTEQGVEFLRGGHQAEQPGAVVLDLCSGSGAIALSIAHEVPGARVTAVERAPAAARTIQANAHRLEVPVEVLCADVRTPGLVDTWAGVTDLVISNPPYIPPDGVPVDPEVREYDPPEALYGGGADGLALPRAVIAVAARALRSGGLFVMEHAEDQGGAVRRAVAATGCFTTIETRADLSGRDRMVVAVRAGQTGAEETPKPRIQQFVTDFASE